MKVIDIRETAGFRKAFVTCFYAEDAVVYTIKIIGLVYALKFLTKTIQAVAYYVKEDAEQRGK